MQRKKFDSINVVPFIDIMLVLLVIVLTTASFIQTNALKINLPTSKIDETLGQKKELKITIDKANNIYFEAKEVKKESVAKELSSYQKDTTLKLYCDKDTKFENFSNILSTAKSLGFNSIAVVTKNE